MRANFYYDELAPSLKIFPSCNNSSSCRD